MIQDGFPLGEGGVEKGDLGSGAASPEHNPQDDLPDGGAVAVEGEALRRNCHLLLDRIPAPRLYEAHAFLRFLTGKV